jgi:hypothetical protein
VERRRRGGEVVCARLQPGILERRLADLHPIAERLAQVRGERGVGLEQHERRGAEREQPPSRLPRSGPDLERARAAAEAAALDEELVDALGVPGSRPVVAARVRPEQPPAFPAVDQSHGGGLCTQRPPTIVATTSTDASSSGGHSTGSRESTTRSAR